MLEAGLGSSAWASSQVMGWNRLKPELGSRGGHCPGPVSKLSWVGTWAGMGWNVG
jgi:hypothetical protein